MRLIQKTRTFIILGTPVAKGRARVTRWGTYTPKKTVEYEKLVKESYLKAYPDSEYLEGYVMMQAAYYMPITKSTNKKNRALMILEKLLPNKKPDIANISKSIEDGLNKVAYEDDNCIVSSYVDKYYSEDPRAEITLSQFIVEGD